MEKNKIKSILYARVSTEELEQNNSYIQQQLYQDDKFDIVRIFSDKASGGSVDKREDFLNMLSYCGLRKDGNNYFVEKRTDIECIIVDDCSPDNSMIHVASFLEQYEGKIIFKIVTHEKNHTHSFDLLPAPCWLRGKNTGPGYYGHHLAGLRIHPGIMPGNGADRGAADHRVRLLSA